MFKNLAYITIFILSSPIFGQYSFEGQLSEQEHGKTVYLSIVEDYRKLARPYLEQIIKKTKSDSLGHFKFDGNNLFLENRIYRIHVDACSTDEMSAAHFFNDCKNSRSILFIANNRDTLFLPATFDDEVLCEVHSTNDKSSVFLEIDVLKEEMALDFYDFPSAANRKLNAEKWFSTLQSFGQQLNEPLAELYIYDFLSDKRNEIYPFYIKNLTKTNYYTDLANRLEEKYAGAEFTQLYLAEIATDQQIASHKTSNPSWNYILYGLLACSIFLNGLLIIRHKAVKKKIKNQAYDTLTTQERNVVAEILNRKTNKEIAADLFISVSTVKTHINNLYKKLQVSSRDEIIKRFE